MKKRNSWKEGNIFRVWTQQPFDYRHLYTNNLDWRGNVTGGGGRPPLSGTSKKKDKTINVVSFKGDGAEGNV